MDFPRSSSLRILNTYDGLCFVFELNVDSASIRVSVDVYLLGDLVECLGLLGEHILSLVPVPGPGALRVHLHCHLMRAVTP